MIRVNLLPNARFERVKRKINRELKAMAMAMAVVILACGVVWFFQHRALVRVNAEMAEADRELARLRRIAREYNELASLKKDIENKISTIIKLKGQQTGPVHILDELTSQLTDQVWLTDFQNRGGTIEINGFSFSNVSIANFMKNLEASSVFKDVVLAETYQSVIENQKVVGFKLFLSEEGSEEVREEG